MALNGSYYRLELKEKFWEIRYASFNRIDISIGEGSRARNDLSYRSTTYIDAGSSRDETRLIIEACVEQKMLQGWKPINFNHILPELPDEFFDIIID